VTTPVEHRASRPGARQWPDGGKTASGLPAASKSAAVLSAATKGAKWLTGPAGKLLTAGNGDIATVTPAANLAVSAQVSEP
jgi:hypothetical protein